LKGASITTSNRNVDHAQDEADGEHGGDGDAKQLPGRSAVGAQYREVLTQAMRRPATKCQVQSIRDIDCCGSLNRRPAYNRAPRQRDAIREWAMQKLGWWPAMLAALVFSWPWADGAPAMPAAYQPAHGDVVYVIAGGWHTEVALPVAEIGGPLAQLAAVFVGTSYLIFGWGARDFYTAQNPGFGDLLRAAVPGPAVMLVIPSGAAPTVYLNPANVWAISLAQGAAGLSQFLWNSLAKNQTGVPIRVGDGPYPQSVFYAATGTYDASDTCNTWTAEALRAAGLPVSAAGVIFPGQVLDQLQLLTLAPAHTYR
jgi:uncharacterized protein (TIGR02117 family)